MRYWETIDKRTIDGFDIVLSVSYEDEPLSSLLPDDSEEQIQELADKIERGDTYYFCARVQAMKAGIVLGEDHLGGCIYDSYQDFINDGYYEDMTSNAIFEAKEALPNLIEELSA